MGETPMKGGLSEPCLPQKRQEPPGGAGPTSILPGFRLFTFVTNVLASQVCHRLPPFFDFFEEVSDAREEAQARGGRGDPPVPEVRVGVQGQALGRAPDPELLSAMSLR